MKKILLITTAIAIMAYPCILPEVTRIYADEGHCGVASWYGFSSPGILNTTANMETFDENALTCAIWDYPFNTYLKVTNLENGKSVVVRVNDRGPAKRLVEEGRLVDLTKRAFSEIAELEKGLVLAKVEEVCSDSR